MIKGLFETHIFVKNLEVSIDFYQNTLGLTLCHIDQHRRIAFFWIGKPKEAMLGVWEKPRQKIDIRHFAFQCDAHYILAKSVPFLKESGIKPYNFLNNGTENPMVFAWIPAIAIYFADPDGHELEFIGILGGKSRPELGIIEYEKWLAVEDQKSNGVV